MAINIPTGTTQYLINDDGQTYVLSAGSTLEVDGADSAILAEFGSSDDKLILKGAVSQTGEAAFAVAISGDDMTVQLTSKGSIAGNGGLEFNGPNAILNNAGKITADGEFGYGVYYEGLNTQITNAGRIIATGASGSGIYASGQNSEINSDGRIQGFYGINVSDARTTIELGVHSKLIGSEAAIFSENAEAADKISVLNNGQITGQNGAFALSLGDSNDKIVNHGTIAGQIYLGSGKDTFDNRGGTVDHVIRGGAGDDTLITDSATVKLKENGGSEGYDTVQSTVSYTLSANVEKLVLMGKGNINGTGTGDGDDLFGNAGNNKLSGLQGVDSLDGGKGNDLLIGGGGADLFVFKTGNAHDTITDFENGTDFIDVSHWTGIDNFADVKAHLTASGGDLFITLGSDQLIIKDMTKAELGASDFVFPDQP